MRGCMAGKRVFCTIKHLAGNQLSEVERLLIKYMDFLRRALPFLDESYWFFICKRMNLATELMNLCSQARIIRSLFLCLLA